MPDVPDLVGDRGRFNEKVVGRIGESLARPLEVDDGVNQYVCDVYALWPEFPRDGFGEDPLSGLSRRETSEVGFAAQCRGVAAGDDCALARLDHCRCKPAREMQQSHSVHLKVANQHLGIDFHEIPERAADRVMNHHARWAEAGANRVDSGTELRFVGYVTRISVRVCDFALEHAQPFTIASEHRDRITAVREASGDRCAGPGTYTCDQRYGHLFVHGRSPRVILTAIISPHDLPTARSARVRAERYHPRHSQVPPGLRCCPRRAAAPTRESGP